MTALIYSEDFLEHKTGDSPECPERLIVILKYLMNNPLLWKKLLHSLPRKATETEIARCHPIQHIRYIQFACPQDQNQLHWLDPDTAVSKNSFDVALTAAGAGLVAVDKIMSGEVQNAFCLIRPPGHHATSTNSMGFCLFNNAAITARYAQDQYQLKNILIIDWDVHHGNGTQEIFYDDASVFYFSQHEYPFYPGTGAADEIGVGAGINTTLNIPVPADYSRELYREKFTSTLLEIEKKFHPDLIIISAGFDARKDDPLANLQLTGLDYLEMTREIMGFARRACAGRIVSLLEGGYLSPTLGEVVCEHVRGLMEI